MGSVMMDIGTLEKMTDENAPIPYRVADIRDRLDVIRERVIKLEGRQEGHEEVCTQRYSQVIKDIAAVQTNLAINVASLQKSISDSNDATQKTLVLFAKVGLAISFLLFMIELGRATFPAIFDLLTKGH